MSGDRHRAGSSGSNDSNGSNGSILCLINITLYCIRLSIMLYALLFMYEFSDV